MMQIDDDHPYELAREKLLEDAWLLYYFFARGYDFDHELPDRDAWAEGYHTALIAAGVTEIAGIRAIHRDILDHLADYIRERRQLTEP